jgi:transposase
VETIMPLVAVEIELSGDERAVLERIVRSPRCEQRMVTRARVVLAAADGVPNRQIARRVGLSERKVGVWRNRFAEHRLDGLRDLPRPGAKRRYDHDKRLEVFKTACSDPPEGETHWTVRSLARAVGVGKSQTHAFLTEADLRPHQVASWLTSLDPNFDTKAVDVCGLYLDPPENAIVVSIDEKTSIQAREPIRKEVPMRPGKPARREFEYRRHGVQALLAALLVHTGEILGEVYDRNSRVEFIDFLDKLEQQIPAGKDVHAILDNLQVHKTPEVTAWLNAHPRWTFHFTPTHASWLNQIELFFSILSRRLLRRGIFTSQTDLKTQLLAYIDRYNPTARPFAWTYEGKPLKA